MNINATLMDALRRLVNDNCWPLGKPVNEDPDEYIVFNPENEYLDYGDDVDTGAEMSYQVHWFKRGQCNYRPARNAIKRALRRAGFVIEPSPYIAYDVENSSSVKGTGAVWTHICIVCRAEDD